MIRVTAQTAAAEAMVRRVRDGLTPERVDIIVDKVAFVSLASMVQASPKRWFGQIRSGWTVTKPFTGARSIDIPASQRSASGTSVADIARFVDQGTANDGSGFIYPTRAKRLYIPLKRTAALGWREGLVYGVDYILRPFVRGIKGRHFIAPERKKAFERLRIALREHVRSLVRGGGSAKK